MNSILKRLLRNVGMDFLFDLLLDEVLKAGEGELAKNLQKRTTPERRKELVASFRKIADAFEMSNFAGAAKEIIVVLRKIKI